MTIEPSNCVPATLRLALRPDLGGCIAGLWYGDVPVLRGAERRGARRRAAVGLLPARALFRPARPAALPLAGPRPHHGAQLRRQPALAARRGWQRPWQVARGRRASAELRLAHAARRALAFRLRGAAAHLAHARALELSMSCTNTSPAPQPMGLGWHPYFPKRARSRVHAEVASRWETDVQQLPTRRVAQPGIDGDVAHLDFDQLLRGLAGARRASATRSSRCASPRRCRTSWSTRRATSPTTAWSP